MERLTGSRPRTPEGTKFVWGPVDKIHEIGDFMIYEYRQDLSTTFNATEEDHGKTKFHIFVNNKDTNTCADTLDAALAVAIAFKYEGYNHRADGYFLKMIGAL